MMRWGSRLLVLGLIGLCGYFYVQTREIGALIMAGALTVAGVVVWINTGNGAQ